MTVAISYESNVDKVMMRLCLSLFVYIYIHILFVIFFNNCI